MTFDRIDVHAHFIPAFYRDALIAAGHAQPDGMPGIPVWSEKDALETMDKLEIQTAIMSISSPGVHFGDDQAAKDLARRINREAARLSGTYPGRFGFFAATPLPNVEMAIEEAVYALDGLGAHGICVETNHHNVYLGDAKLDPFYAELNSRKAVMFIHPTSPSCTGCGTLSFGYPRPMLEFMFETTRAVTQLVLSGSTVRFPDIRIIVPHAGAALPILASRVDSMAPFALASGKQTPNLRAEMHKLYYDLAGMPLPELLEALLKIADPEHLLYGSDWPFTPLAYAEELASQLDKTPLLEGNLHQAVMSLNALKMFDKW